MLTAETRAQLIEAAILNPTEATMTAIETGEGTVCTKCGLYPDLCTCSPDHTLRQIGLLESADPFVSPKHKGTIFYNHHCSVCNDGERPCREGRPGLCGNPRARND